MNLEESIAVLSGISCILSLLCIIFHAVGFGTRNWLEGDGISPFVRIGFHEACFDHCHEPWCKTGIETVAFEGCHWVFSNEFESSIITAREWLIPDWFMDLRDIAIGVIPLTIFCFMMLCIATIMAFSGHNTTEYKPRREIAHAVVLFFSALLLVVTGSLCVVILSTFYTNARRRDWMPMPERNSFGYSFWLEFTTACLLIFSFVLTLIASVLKLLDMNEERDTPYAEDMMLGKR